MYRALLLTSSTPGNTVSTLTAAADQVVVIQELPLPTTLEHYQKKDQAPLSTKLRFNYNNGIVKSIYIGFVSTYRF